jgi:hypothetical protein
MSVMGTDASEGNLPPQWEGIWQYQTAGYLAFPEASLKELQMTIYSEQAARRHAIDWGLHASRS